MVEPLPRIDTCICMYVLYVHDAVKTLCGGAVARAWVGATLRREERDDDGTYSSGKTEKDGAIGGHEGHGRGRAAGGEQERDLGRHFPVF